MSAHTPSAYKGFDLESGDRILFFLKAAIVALVFLTFGVGATALLASAACAAMAFEWFRMTTGGRDFDEPLVGVVLAAGALPPFFTFAVGGGGGAAIAFLGAGFLLIMGPKENGLLVRTALGLVVIGVAGVCFVWLRSHPEHGLALTAWLLFVVGATELGSGIAARRAASDAEPATDDGRVPSREQTLGLIAGIVGGFVVFAFYRDGNALWVVLASLILAGVVLLAGLVTRVVRQSVDATAGKALFPGRGTVVENFDGLVWASIAAGLSMMCVGVLFNW